MDTDWEVCSMGTVQPRQDETLCISLNGEGDLTFNKAAWQAVGAPEHVKLYFDRAARRIGLRKCEWNDRDAALCYTRPGTRYPVVVRARRLLQQFGLAIMETIRFLPPVEEMKGIYVLDLKTAFVPEQVRLHFWNNLDPKKPRPSRGGSPSLSAPAAPASHAAGPRSIYDLPQDYDADMNLLFIESRAEITGQPTIWYTQDSKARLLRHERRPSGIEIMNLGRTEWL